MEIWRVEPVGTYGTNEIMTSDLALKSLPRVMHGTRGALYNCPFLSRDSAELCSSRSAISTRSSKRLLRRKSQAWVSIAGSS